MSALFKAVSGVSTMWSLAAFAIAALVYLATRKAGSKARGSTNTLVVAIVLLGLVPIIGSLYVNLRGNDPTVYSLRAVVLNPEKAPVDNAKVWSSQGGEPKKVDGGWQFDMPAASVSASHKVTVYAEVQAAFLKGQNDITLGSDFHPNLTIQLAHSETSIRGIVTDEKGRAIEGVLVGVIGYGSEITTTKTDGGFEVPAHAADGQQVQLHAEKSGLVPGGGWYPAGKTPAEIVLRRE